VKDATEVIVVVDADSELRAQLAKIEVDVLDETGKHLSDSHSFELTGQTALPLSFGVHQAPSGAEWFMVITRGLDPAGELLIQDKAISHFERGKTTHEQVDLSSMCRGNFCSGATNQACKASTGQCQVVGRSSSDEDAGPTDLDPDAGSQSDGARGNEPAPSVAGEGGQVGMGTLTDAGTDASSEEPPFCVVDKSRLPCALAP
jgi:hypothetical protein